MWQEYAPEPRMRLNLGIRRRLAPLLDNDRGKIALANSLLFSLPGSPVLYYGDEIGMGDNIYLFDRNGVRTPMQWTAEPGGGFSTASLDKLYVQPISQAPYHPAVVNVQALRQQTGSLWHTIQRMIALRKQHPVLGLGEFAWALTDDTALAAYIRSSKDDRILIVNNLTPFRKSARITIEDLSFNTSKILLASDPETEYHLHAGNTISLEIPPYGYCWIQLTK